MGWSMIRRIAPPLVLLAGLVLFFALGLEHRLGLDALRLHRLAWTAWVQRHAWTAPLGYMLAYVAVVAFSLPVATVMTMTGGFLFGAVAGALYAVVGATMGATLLFLVAKGSLGDFLLAKAGPRVQRMRAGFAGNAFHYLLALRLVPMFPFFLVNLAPAFLGVSLRVYVTATLLGIVPASFVYALAGAGIGGVLEQGGVPTVSGVLSPQVIGALCGLALLSLLPVIVKWRRRGRGGSA